MHGGDDPVFDGFAGQLGVVGLDGFGDLAADGHDRVERGHWLLKDHGETATAMAAHGFFRKREEFFACKLNAAGDVRDGGQEAQQGQRCGGLAAAGFADQTEGFSGCNVEGDALDGWVCAKGDAQIADFKEGRIHRADAIVAPARSGKKTTTD
ncbi:hypothetical protein GCM10011507_25800 [Edaphobacter acidisoli]|uniref:Uncharacterized protein n=1 Tax=Edaphobacter acidisoli TaxID=2040573 RepID=A0A916W759_9BACT|nr:hypothetical protein GCM10011507_25800 [Edaphobacter acidisoli]